MLPDRLPGNRQNCLDKAVECDRKAAQARDPNAAKEFQSLAARWRVAAVFDRRPNALSHGKDSQVLGRLLL